MDQYIGIKGASLSIVEEVFRASSTLLKHEDSLSTVVYKGNCYISEALFSRLVASSNYASSSYMLHWNPTAENASYDLFFDKLNLFYTSFYRVKKIVRGAQHHQFVTSDSTNLFMLYSDEIVTL